MTALCEVLTGSGLIISLSVFILGMIFRFVLYFKNLDWRLDRIAYKAYLGRGLKGGIHSALKWLVPFATRGWRAQPFFSLCFFLFHCGAVLVPLFLAGHTEVLQRLFGFFLPSLPQIVADILTIATLVGAFFIVLRRLAVPEVRLLTTWYDYLILFLAVVPFITGFAARMGLGHYQYWMLAHLITGNLFLIVAPFTKLSHIVLYFASRWQIGADYGIKRGGESRGACFPW